MLLHQAIALLKNDSNGKIRRQSWSEGAFISNSGFDERFFPPAEIISNDWEFHPGGLSFEEALAAMRKGKKVQPTCWRGSSQYLRKEKDNEIIYAFNDHEENIWNGNWSIEYLDLLYTILD